MVEKLNGKRFHVFTKGLIAPAGIPSKGIRSGIKEEGDRLIGISDVTVSIQVSLNNQPLGIIGNTVKIIGGIHILV